MASSAPKVAEKEHHESPHSIERKAQLLTEQIKKSKHLIAFTGAGISTSAELSHVISPASDEGTLYLLGYSPYTGEWKITKQDNTNAGEEPRDNAEKAEDSVLLSTAPDGLPDNIRRTRAANILPPITA
ncbi:MAG: hypothetical protein LQ349_004617 [Xanthoria aureola]|nr:MAG: hypothetical protein LQ349_004617 [Xanthoria aureola]